MIGRSKKARARSAKETRRIGLKSADRKKKKKKGIIEGKGFIQKNQCPSHSLSRRHLSLSLFSFRSHDPSLVSLDT